jgi:hypothetical protein
LEQHLGLGPFTKIREVLRAPRISPFRSGSGESAAALTSRSGRFASRASSALPGLTHTWAIGPKTVIERFASAGSFLDGAAQ